MSVQLQTNTRETENHIKLNMATQNDQRYYCLQYKASMFKITRKIVSLNEGTGKILGIEKVKRSKGKKQ